MGRYSRKDMIEFANFAKSWQSPQTVELAYQRYLKGDMLICIKRKRVEVKQQIIPNIPLSPPTGLEIICKMNNKNNEI